MPKNDWKKVRVGSPIAVYFRKDRCYYACTVLEKKGTSFKIEYEDNTTEWKNLSKAPFRWQELPNIGDEQKERSSEKGKDSSDGEDEGSSSEEDENSSDDEDANSPSEEDDDSSYGEDEETREDEE